MQIQKVNLLSLHAPIINKKNLDRHPQERREINELPPAYADFNISFGAQLNRTPANFYEFNKKNLPDSMRNYLNADYEDRQHMPPAQMMKVVYDDLNLIKSLDFVPRIYPDEPLFAELTDEPNRKAKKGLVSQVETLREEFASAPLFKDGTSNLGMYLLKKIYLEGKQKKEINDDFYKDLSKEYEGLITEPVDYSTFSAYGIKFPKVPFWNSFVVTRDDWNYVYKPRTVEGSRISSGEKREVTLADILSGKVPLALKPPKFKIDKPKVDKITDAVLNGHGDSKVTEKLLKRKGLNDNEELSFVSRYLSQIMSVALENIHASDEMRNFFEKYDTMNKKQRDKLEFYWKNNQQMRQLQSLAISDAIKLFFEAYGADGNNEVFQDLLTYADSIKPTRERNIMLHNEKQAEYEAMFEELEAREDANALAEAESVEDVLRTMSEEELTELLEIEARKNNAQIFAFVSPEGKTHRYIGNLDEMFKKHICEDMNLFPATFKQRYFRFIDTSPLATDDYRKAVALRSIVEPFAQEQLASIEELRAISFDINNEYNKKYPHVIRACNQAILETLAAKYPQNSELAGLLDRGISYITTYAEDKLGITSWTPEEAEKLENDFMGYLSPVQRKEDINKLSKILTDYIYNLDMCKTYYESTFFDDLIKLLAFNIKEYPKSKLVLERAIKQSNFMKEYGGASKLLLKPNVSKELKEAALNLMMINLLYSKAGILQPFFVMSPKSIQTYISDKELRDDLMMKAIFNY